MKILITGSNGQLGFELQRAVPAGVEAIFTGSAELDITNPDAVRRVIAELKADAVINAAAYTAVDKAESDKTQCYRVNADAAGYLAAACRENDARLVHVSTDFVFDGTAQRPYLPQDATAPLSVYGDSKLQGEQQVLQALAVDHKAGYAIVRTSWVYSSHGNNFVKTMLRLMKEREQLGIVADQRGTPTWACNLAWVCWQLALQSDVNGIFHYSDGSAAGHNCNQGISWYEFAAAIQEIGIEQGLLDKAIPLNAITTADYPTPATRPAYSVMDTGTIQNSLGFTAPYWRDSLQKMMQALSL
ncbi:dTDP-4-dehydrorhamnose reductase [Shewanella sp. JM162201]|uniref:dTDP-4-dehydrorhamnose reductase n=1 Tax=Shewanella jiangmenensis TaxID=2837387 RepID=A0ABS5V8L1_9GAMM|nr:dTDP-4-dehydrorhamnose reductase [Shewanella jiangmenensis]MBT1445348.1 dTDP-4-dehydrorhamnose reductase [Shewanella jiangmenensis]